MNWFSKILLFGVSILLVIFLSATYSEIREIQIEDLSSAFEHRSPLSGYELQRKDMVSAGWYVVGIIGNPFKSLSDCNNKLVIFEQITSGIEEYRCFSVHRHKIIR